MKIFVKCAVMLLIVCVFAAGMVGCASCGNDDVANYIELNRDSDNANNETISNESNDADEHTVEHEANDVEIPEYEGTDAENGEAYPEDEEIFYGTEDDTETDTGNPSEDVSDEPPSTYDENSPQAFAARAFAQAMDFLYIPAGAAGAFDIGLSLNLNSNASTPNANVRFITNGRRAETLFTMELDLGGFLGVHNVMAYTLRENGEIADTRLFFGDMELQAETIRLFGLTEMAGLATFDIQDVFTAFSLLPDITAETLSDYSIELVKLADGYVVSLSIEGVDSTFALPPSDILDMAEISAGRMVVSFVMDYENVREMTFEFHSDGGNVQSVIARLNATGNAVRITLP